MQSQKAGQQTAVCSQKLGPHMHWMA